MIENKQKVSSNTIDCSYYCGICGRKWNSDESHDSINGDHHDLILPSREKVEICDQNEELSTSEIHMKKRFRTVCYTCFLAIADFVESRKNLSKKINDHKEE